MMTKIYRLEAENVKRIKAVTVEPAATGLTIVGGDNNQGKTSVLDSIAWALGGEKYKPSQPQREDSILPPQLRVVLSNGFIVERKGKNSDLKVTDPNGNKGGQSLLNEFVEQLAIDLPRFMQSSNKEKANILLHIIGVGDKLYALEQEEQELYNQRRTIGQIADQKTKFAKEMPYHTDAPKDLVSASELIRQQQDILAKNGENQRKRDRLHHLEHESTQLQMQVDALLEKQILILADLDIARKSAADLHDESTAALKQNIDNVEAINGKVRNNLDKDKAEEDAQGYGAQYSALTIQIDDIRKTKTDLLDGATLPLVGLSVEEGELTYNGYRWDNMSGSDQLKVSTAIVRKLNPKCGFVLLDKLEQMDLNTLHEFGEWLEQEGLQAIATRVSTGDECSIIIEDGRVSDPSALAGEEQNKWKAGEF